MRFKPIKNKDGKLPKFTEKMAKTAVRIDSEPRLEVRSLDWAIKEGIYYEINQEWIPVEKYKGDYRDIEGIMTKTSYYLVGK